jgi:hypothetical protein
LERGRTFGGFQVGADVCVVSFVQHPKAARMRAKRSVRNHVYINSREESIIHCVGMREFAVNNLFRGYNYSTRRSRHHQVIAMAWCYRITPAVRFDGVKDGDVGANPLRHNDLFTRVERILPHEEIRTVLENIAV